MAKHRLIQENVARARLSISGAACTSVDRKEGSRESVRLLTSNGVFDAMRCTIRGVQAIDLGRRLRRKRDWPENGG